MKEVRSPGGDVREHRVDVVGLDRQLGAVLGGVLGALDQEHLDLVSPSNDEAVVPVEDLHPDSVDEQVDAHRDVAVEDLGHEVRQHVLTSGGSSSGMPNTEQRTKAATCSRPRRS
jgi:hypothetical protein